MGHERVGILPKSKTWRKVVAQISEFSSYDKIDDTNSIKIQENNNIAEIAKNVLKNVRDRIEYIENDKGIISAFKFLVMLSFASKQKEPLYFLKENGVNLSNLNSPLQIGKGVDFWINEHKESDEYASMARASIIDAITVWLRQNQSNQENLFFNKDPYETWRKSANGAGFCELSRLFFSKFTERYLKYFLEREASANINSISEREIFNSNIENHIQNISKHAFETAKITQSFAAGWFNKNVKENLPSDIEIKGFLNIAFGKIRAELLREEVRKEENE